MNEYTDFPASNHGATASRGTHDETFDHALYVYSLVDGCVELDPIP